MGKSKVYFRNCWQCRRSRAVSRHWWLCLLCSLGWFVRTVCSSHLLLSVIIIMRRCRWSRVMIHVTHPACHTLPVTWVCKYG